LDNAVVLLPSYGGILGHHAFALSKINCEQVFLFGAPIDQARCYMISEAMNNFPEKDVFIFIDSDISFTAADLQKLSDDCNRTKEIVSGCYVLKTDNTNRIVANIDSTQPIDRSDGLIPCSRIGMGFAAIHRLAIERIRLNMDTCNLPRSTGMTVLHPLFIPMIHNGDYLGEDYAFCVRAKEAGVNIWLDSNILLTHWGVKGYQLQK
jgi:hypothetical protein